MTDYVVSLSSGRSGTYPLPGADYGGHFVGTRATFCLAGDLINPGANVLAMPQAPVVSLTLSPISVAEEFFGQHVYYRANDALTGITCKTVRSHDMVSGKSRWKYIETADNTWDFTDLDAWVEAHYAAGRDIIFTLYGTPTWASARPAELGAYGGANLGTQAEPADMTKWDRYCNKIVSRYLGKIKYFEVWNEPNQYNDGTGVVGGATNFFYSGTFAKLAEMTRRANQAIKAVDPTAKILSPAITGWSPTAAQSAETYFTGMMSAPTGDGSTTLKNWIDIVAVHLYVTVNRLQDLSGIIDRINAAKTTAGVSGKETWDTESAPIGAGAVSLMTDAGAKRAIGRVMITMAAKGIARTIYYQYDSAVMGFSTRPDIVAYYQQLVTLLRSGNILAASRFSDGKVAYNTASGVVIL